MSWKNILKTNSLVDEMEAIMRDAGNAQLEEYSRADWGDFVQVAVESIPKLKGKLSEEHFKNIEDAVDKVFGAKSEYEAILDEFVEVMDEISDEYKEETNSDSDIRETPSGGRGKVHPAFKDYKLKDDEMWGEPMGDGLMMPVKIDSQYGAEY